MTPGQDRALQELQRVCAAAPDTIEIVGSPQEIDSSLVVLFNFRLGLLECKIDGLPLREREEFIVVIPPDFPFDHPSIKVTHRRFAGFPHVIWAKTLCLYQSAAEWNPSDGIYGFLDRLNLWLGRAAMNDMDPLEGPLEPPHHVTDFSQVPFVIRANAPVSAGTSWFGLAVLDKQENRTELIDWKDNFDNWPQGKSAALSIILSDPLPMEFPSLGADLFAELEKQGWDKESLMKRLALAALLSGQNEPMHLIVGLPMRRATDGTLRLHIAVWTTKPEFTQSLRSTIPEGSDSQALTSARKELTDTIYELFKVTTISWCKVLEDRNEIVVRRESRSALAWLADKKILILGCGALGSWAAEIAVRSRAASVHVLDRYSIKAVVNPGILCRQNYTLKDIGQYKVEALAKRLKDIAPQGVEIQPLKQEAHAYLTENPKRTNQYDVIIDCTASHIFQMKLERDWKKFNGNSPYMISMIIDAYAHRGLSVLCNKNSSAGIWDAYTQLKKKISFDESCKVFVSAFYSADVLKDLFQPEPGCSDPTFSGSSADATALVSTALNLSIPCLSDLSQSKGFAFSNHQADCIGVRHVYGLSEFIEVVAGNYRVRIDPRIYTEVKGWKKRNARLHSADHETGGLIWGLWDDATDIIWVFDISGPPKDSLHEPAHFECGTDGVLEEHERRIKKSNGVCGFTGLWHTHPDMPSRQSFQDITGMSSLVSRFGQNKKRSLMLIFGNRGSTPTMGVYVYESESGTNIEDVILIHQVQQSLPEGAI